jgi:Zn-dependent M16 (insulinase) family peptidase
MKMLHRSFASYMNALTALDYTMYPFATTIDVDYQNLMNVYLDSCFNPILDKSNFLQEAWRLSNDGLSPIEFKGVVYNEMKGALADPNAYFYYEHLAHLYKGTCYGFNSGGDPECITNLEWEDMVQFHRERYHPSNAFVYTFGNADENRTMDILSKYIDNYSAIEPTPVDAVSRWSAPKNITSTGPMDRMMDPTKQNRVSISFLTNPAKESMTSMSLAVLSSLLVDGAASPMYKALIETNLGSDYGPTTGLNTSCYDASLSFGLQGVDDEKVEKVKSAIWDCLHETRKNGFPKSRVNSVFDQYELGIKHVGFILHR